MIFYIASLEHFTALLYFKGWQNSFSSLKTHMIKTELNYNPHGVQAATNYTDSKKIFHFSLAFEQLKINTFI